jgi:hypothetical protein
MNDNTIPAEGLYFLWHPGTQDVFSGYGLNVQAGRKGRLVGLLMVDRPQPVDPNWLAAVKARFGRYELHIMTARQERGIACQMWIEPESEPFLRPFDTQLTASIAQVLAPLLHQPPRPRFRLRWNQTLRLWTSEFQE